MLTYRLFDFHKPPGIKVFGGNSYYLRTRWAISQALLQQPPGDVRTPVNYLETPAVWVAVEPTPTTPVVIRFDPLLWEIHAGIERNLFAVVEYRFDANSAWQHFEDIAFIINHQPTANAGPDQVVILDDQGRTPDNVSLNASGSDDPDLHAAVNPDPGPLAFSWWPEETPLSITANTAVWNAAYELPEQPQPLFLPAYTNIPFADRGAYTFRVGVRDNDRADLGLMAGNRGSHSATTRVLLGVGGPNLSIESPTTETPSFQNVQDGINVSIYYSIGDTIASDPAYDGAWVVKCQIIQAIESQIFPSETVGTVVFEREMVSFQRVNYFQWNGIKTHGVLPGSPAIGAFDIRMELLDRHWNSTAVAGNVATIQRAIVIDFVRWLLPVDTAFADATQSGTFMESGHAGTLGTQLHTGIDIISLGIASPDIVAARSGFYTLLGAGANWIRLTHSSPDSTHYLHGDTLEAIMADQLVVQGQRLARMSNIGTVNAHLHFEHHTEPPLRVHNPLRLIPLRDEVAPQIDSVAIRDSPASIFDQADLNNSATGIRTFTDLIVKCRDRAHPLRDTAMDNGPYRVRVVDTSGLTNPPEIRFDTLSAINRLWEFYAQQANSLAPASLTAANHFLPYIRWETSAYNKSNSPLTLRVEISDFGGRVTSHEVVVGAQCNVVMGPANPATSAAAPAPFQVTIQVENRTSGLAGVVAENFHITLMGAPVGWTVAPTRSGNLAGGAVQNVVLTIDPNGSAPAGNHPFEVVVYSEILEQVGLRLPITVTVAP